MKNTDYYETELTLAKKQKLQYLFVSIGNAMIIKAIQYSPILKLNGRTIYNLGFGDYDEALQTIVDDSNSNNGDVHMVFNTVLHSVPEFFSLNPDAVLYVCGSDSKDNFKNVCSQTCRNIEKCKDSCRKEDRRIKIYCNYVDKNFDDLSTEYIFFGRNKAVHETFVEYIPWQKYHEILVYKIK